jgi:hypothetical protein
MGNPDGTGDFSELGDGLAKLERTNGGARTVQAKPCSLFNRQSSDLAGAANLDSDQCGE